MNPTKPSPLQLLIGKWLGATAHFIVINELVAAEAQAIGETVLAEYCAGVVTTYCTNAESVAEAAGFPPGVFADVLRDARKEIRSLWPTMQSRELAATRS